MLGRAGFDAVLIDPHKLYPFDFRCEKLDASQVRLVHKTGLGNEILAAGAIDEEVWIARFAILSVGSTGGTGNEPPRVHDAARRRDGAKGAESCPTTVLKDLLGNFECGIGWPMSIGER